MGSKHSPADDIVYNLISIQYHALKAADLYDTYLQDADPQHEEVGEFIRECQRHDAWRGERAHELLRDLTKEHGLTPQSGG
jgi:hypothetical protein